MGVLFIGAYHSSAQVTGMVLTTSFSNTTLVFFGISAGWPTEPVTSSASMVFTLYCWVGKDWSLTILNTSRDSKALPWKSNMARFSHSLPSPAFQPAPSTGIQSGSQWKIPLPPGVLSTSAARITSPSIKSFILYLLSTDALRFITKITKNSPYDKLSNLSSIAS